MGETSTAGNRTNKSSKVALVDNFRYNAGILSCKDRDMRRIMKQVETERNGYTSHRILHIRIRTMNVFFGSSGENSSFVVLCSTV